MHVKKYNSKIAEIESKIPSISGLDTTATLTAVENKIPSVSSLVKKKKKEIITPKFQTKFQHFSDNNNDKYVTTREFNKPTARNFAARLAQANLVRNTDFNMRLVSPNKKINSNKLKYILVENELNNYKHLI